MAVKDTAPYLRDCLSSILLQSYVNWELIAINDHSIDNSGEILKEYASTDSRIKYHNANRHKLIPVLKEAYRHSSGSLINRMDSDDKMPDYKLQVLVNKWIEYGKGHVVAGGTKHFVDEGKLGDGFLQYDNWLNHIAKNNLHYQEIYRECVIPSHCWILHRDDFEQINGFEPEVYPEDYDLCFRMYKENLKIIGIDKVLHHWRDRDERISRTWDEYKDNRYFEMKLRYFYEIDRDRSRPLVVWGAGKNGKDLVKKILKRESEINWICDNKNKIGRDIYGIILEHSAALLKYKDPQVLVVVTNPDERRQIKTQLDEVGLNPVRHYWFFI
ncbi:MAG: glycosyltransferase [Bacteroidia bacterium]|nr:glycosyltransferase [Bacteroidia bacterium]